MCVWFLFCVTFNIKHFHDVGYGFYARILGFILVSQSPQYMSLLCVHGHTWVLYDLHIWEYISRIHIVYYVNMHVLCTCVHMRVYGCVFMYSHMCYCLTMYGSWVIKMQYQWPPAPPHLFIKSVIFTNLIYFYIFIL